MNIKKFIYDIFEFYLCFSDYVYSLIIVVATLFVIVHFVDVILVEIITLITAIGYMLNIMYQYDKKSKHIKECEKILKRLKKC